ncbi:MAG TPA: hypothetical protein VFB65_20715, partial [Pyrinomonadaceae bacterium]|nr:hypothetical protein [Pyrinomonadaceae bacterium]
YGRRVLLFMKDNGLVVVSAVGSLVLVGAIVYLIVDRRRNKLATTETELENVDAAELENPDSERAAD